MFPLFNTQPSVESDPLFLSETRSPLGLPSPKTNPLFYVQVYAIIGLLAVLVSVCSAIAQTSGALGASRILFGQLLESVVRSTMRWYDITPTGRMLNRFSKVELEPLGDQNKLLTAKFIGYPDH